ncbi:MAG: hypothetical protein JW953_00505 [Anaerolineae bacterium]|nr:hypothetical protein [Anaerolineae bacterium]
MLLLKRSSAKNYLYALLVTFSLTAYQLIRIVAFVNVYGGIEHDGGWMLSISRSLADQGDYTTLVSTIADPALPGGINVDQKFDVQAADGRVWFFTGNGIGPASIGPDALVLKLFGTGFWALRLGPLIFYTLFLLLAALILYRLAGWGAIVLFHAFLFFYPHLSIPLSYEAMGEVPGMVYILWAYLAFATVASKPHRQWGHFLLAGLVIGLAINAKLITLWSVGGILGWAGLLWLAGLAQGRIHKICATSLHFREVIALGFGAILPVALWELVHLVVLTHLFSFDLYRQNLQGRIQFILDDGSGVGLRIHSGAEFFWDKFFLLAEIAHPQRWVTAIVFVVIFLGGLALLWLWRYQSAKQNLIAPIWLGWLANTAWFVALAKTGWPRHFWFGLVLAVLLLSVITARSIQYGFAGSKQTLKKVEPGLNIGLRRTLSMAAGSLLLMLLGWGFMSQPHVRGFFLPDEIVAYWQQKQISNKYNASLPWIIIPRATQTEVVNYINHLPPEARIYYPGQHKSAEITPQTGRIHYPLQRRDYVTPHPADIVLISPSIISPWKDPIQRQDLLNLVEQQCPHPAIKNDFYMVCPISNNLPQP